MPREIPEERGDGMPVIERWMLVVDADGQPTEVVRSREQEDALQYNCVEVVEVVPVAEVERLREALTAIASGDVPGTGDWGECLQARARKALDA